MCIAMSGKIIEINKGMAKVDISGNIIDASIRLISPRVGDYVLIHAGCAIEVIDKSVADEISELLSELSANFGESG